MEQQKISSHQLFVIVTLYSTGSAILLLPGKLTSEVQQDAWIAIVIGMILGFLLTLFILKFADRFKDQTLVEFIETTYGKVLGKIIAILLSLFFLINASTVLYNIGFFMKTQLLPETPIQAFNILFMIVVLLGIHYGIESIVRTGEIVFPVLILLFIAMILLISPEVDVRRALPVFENNLGSVLWASILFISLYALPNVTLLMIYPLHVTDQSKGKRAYILGLILAGVILFVATFWCIIVLTPSYTARNTFSVYRLARKIRIGNFIQRIEGIMAISWFVSLFFRVITYFYGAVVGLSQVLRLKNHQSIAKPLGIIVLILSFIVYPDINYATSWDNTTWIPLVLIMGFVLPLVTFIVSIIKNRRNQINRS